MATRREFLKTCVVAVMALPLVKLESVAELNNPLVTTAPPMTATEVKRRMDEAMLTASRRAVDPPFLTEYSNIVADMVNSRGSYLRAKTRRR